MPQCASHATFEKMFYQSIDNLSGSIKEGIASLNRQSQENGASLKLVLENQADRRELCGRQNARIEVLTVSDKEQWSAINDLRTATAAIESMAEDIKEHAAIITELRKMAWMSKGMFIAIQGGAAALGAIIALVAKYALG